MIRKQQGDTVQLLQSDPIPNECYMIMQALLVCEALQKRSAVFAASRFACCTLYGLLGAAGPAATNFAALAIKHIQHDTISGSTLA